MSTSFRIVILLCFILCTDVLGKRGRIVGGDDATIAEYSYQVGFKLISLDILICGGVLITERNIISAAHCFKNREHLYPDIKAFAGTSALNATGTLLNIIRFDLHPNYTGESTMAEAYLHDIAVMTLENALTYSQTVNKIDLPTGDFPPYVHAIIAGWGKTTEAATVPSNELQTLTVVTITTDNCRSYFERYIQDTQICAVPDKGFGTCQGDSGSPLVVGGKVIGILSWIVPCAKGFPDIYTNVWMYMDFINATLQRSTEFVNSLCKEQSNNAKYTSMCTITR